jgi:hypothetical protein
MRVLTPKLIIIDASAFIHLYMLTFATVVKVKNDHVYLTIINTKKIEGTILRPLSNRNN